MTPATITPDALEQARRSLVQRSWAQGTAAGDLADRIVALGMPIGPLHDRDGAVWVERDHSHASLSTLIEGALPGIDRERLAGLSHAAGPASIAPATSVLFTRALTPLAGLRTYPASALYRAEDAAVARRVLDEPLPVPAMPPRAVTGIVKITRACNLRCSYCHDWRVGKGAAMPVEVQARAMRWLIAGTRAASVHVLLHGGEPTLIGVRGLLRLLAFQSAMIAPGQRVRTSIQTNATLLTPALLDLLLRFDIAVSVSLDGPPEVHDATRRDIRGRGSSARVQVALGVLAEKGLLAGVVVVVTRALIDAGAERLVRYLTECGVTSAALIAQRPGHDEPVDDMTTLPMADYCAFLLAVERVRRRIAPGLDVREIDAADKARRGEAPRTCELQGSCVGQYFAIEPDGGIAHCDKFVGDPVATLGTVGDPFDRVARGAAAQKLKARGQATLRALTDCRWRAHCRGWCPHEREVAARSGKSSGCCGLAPLFEGLDEMAAAS